MLSEKEYNKTHTIPDPQYTHNGETKMKKQMFFFKYKRKRSKKKCRKNDKQGYSNILSPSFYLKELLLKMFVAKQHDDGSVYNSHSTLQYSI
jgi:hypothetical protein